jgi:hypothetical protein
MEFKGTKGEWTVKHDTTHIECNNEIISLGGYLRTCDDTRLDGESWLSMRERTVKDRQDIINEQLYNAKLIAAAPELLDALQRVEKAINNMGLNGRFGNTQQYIRQAINKALK